MGAGFASFCMLAHPDWLPTSRNNLLPDLPLADDTCSWITITTSECSEMRPEAHQHVAASAWIGLKQRLQPIRAQDSRSAHALIQSVSEYFLLLFPTFPSNHSTRLCRILSIPSGLICRVTSCVLVSTFCCCRLV